MKPRSVRADSISDAVIREARSITVTGDIVGDWPNADGTHTLIVRVAAAAAVEIRPGGSDA